MSEGDWKGDAFRRTLAGIVRKRVPERDVEDIVQATLTEALSPSAPKEDDALQRWLIGVARHKIADLHRRGQRESFDVPEVHVEAPPHAENDLVRWAERALPEEGDDPRKTLEWMMREGDGEKLESIAESEQLPAPRVRKRVSRLRQHLRAAWRKEVALLAALGVVATLVWLARRDVPEQAHHEELRPVPSELALTPDRRARQLREAALGACGRSAWATCLDGLDRAKELDPPGDAEPRVVSARAAASSALTPVPPPAPTPSVLPTAVPTAVPTSGPSSVPTSRSSSPVAPAPQKGTRIQKPGRSSGSSI